MTKITEAETRYYQLAATAGQPDAPAREQAAWASANDNANLSVKLGEIDEAGTPEWFELLVSSYASVLDELPADEVPPAQDAAMWTLVYRTPRGRIFRPVTGLPETMTWAEASHAASKLVAIYGDAFEIWTTTAKGSAGVVPEDVDSIMLGTGKRLPVRWDAASEVDAGVLPREELLPVPAEVEAPAVDRSPEGLAARYVERTRVDVVEVESSRRIKSGPREGSVVVLYRKRAGWQGGVEQFGRLAEVIRPERIAEQAEWETPVAPRSLNEISKDPRVRTYRAGGSYDQLYVVSPADLDAVVRDYGLVVKWADGEGYAQVR